MKNLFKAFCLILILLTIGCTNDSENSAKDFVAEENIATRQASDILNDLEVEFDPCKNTIEITGLDTSADYDWGDFTGLNNEPDVAISGPNNQFVTLKVLYDGDETLCFNVTVTNGSGTNSLPCEVCYTTPSCRNIGTSVILQPNNLCNFSQCPDGYVCDDGICCLDDPCENPCEGGPFGCGPGYDCVDGCCVAVGGNPCFNDSKCPPGFECIDGTCQTPF